MIKRSSIKQNVQIIAEKTKKNANEDKNNATKCYICNKIFYKNSDIIDANKDCKKEDCPFR